MWFQTTRNYSPASCAYINQESCKLAIASYVDRCDETGINYSREVKGAMIVIPDMFGNWFIGYFVGPEYIRLNKVKYATEEELEKIADSLGLEML
jgi:hypothetical protein